MPQPPKVAHMKALITAREMCDKLLGKQRDIPPKWQTNVKVTFSSRDVCKASLVGLCPNKLFVNTKSDMGPCECKYCGDDNYILMECRKEWNALPQTERDKFGYEQDLLHKLAKLVAYSDRRVALQKKKLLKAKEQEEYSMTEESRKKADELKEEMQKLTQLAAKHGEEGEVDMATAVMNQVEQLEKQRQIVLGGDRSGDADKNQKDKDLFVCEVSGNYMSKLDTEERTQAHYDGRMYKGWKKVRDKFAQLKQKYPNASPHHGANRDMPPRGSSNRSYRDHRDQDHSYRRSEGPPPSSHSSYHNGHRRHHHYEQDHSRNQHRSYHEQPHYRQEPHFPPRSDMHRHHHRGSSAAHEGGNRAHSQRSYAPSPSYQQRGGGASLMYERGGGGSGSGSGGGSSHHRDVYSHDRSREPHGGRDHDRGRGYSHEHGRRRRRRSRSRSYDREHSRKRYRR